MKPRITVLTLGVDDLERAVAFYRDGLGWSTEGIVGTQFEHGAVAFFDLEGGLKLALWPRTSIAADTGIATGRAEAIEFTIGHNVSSAAEVDTTGLPEPGTTAWTIGHEVGTVPRVIPGTTLAVPACPA